MKSIKFVFLMLCLTFVFSCAKEPNTVEYYRTHDAERMAVLEKYKNNPGKFMSDPDSINALEATSKLRSEHLYGGWTDKGKREVNPKIEKLH